MSSKRSRGYDEADEYFRVGPTVALNMFGSEVEFAEGSVVQILPNHEGYYLPNHDEIMQVIVEGIRFIVSRDMLMQEGEPALSDNYFAASLRFHPDRTVFQMTEADADMAMASARMYPVLFDFLRRRLGDPDALPHVNEIYDDDVEHLRALEDVLFPELCSLLPPVIDGSHGSQSVLATPPRVEGGRPMPPYTDDMCLDPAFIRLAMEFKIADPNYFQFHDAHLDDEAVAAVFARPEHQRVMAKYGLTPEAVLGTTLHMVNSCSPVEIERKQVFGLEYSLRRALPHFV